MEDLCFTNTVEPQPDKSERTGDTAESRQKDKICSIILDKFVPKIQKKYPFSKLCFIVVL